MLNTTEDEHHGADDATDDRGSIAHDVVEDEPRGSDVTTKDSAHDADVLREMQFLKNDILEIVNRLTLCAFPFMRNNLKAVNRFFSSTVSKVSCPRVYIPELPNQRTVTSVRKIIMF